MAGLGGHLSRPGWVASSLPFCRRREQGLCIRRVLWEWVPRAFRYPGLQYVLWCPWGSNWCPWGKGPRTQHRDHRWAEEQEARSPTWFGERHHTGEVAPGWPQWAAERTASVKTFTGTTKLSQPHLHLGATLFCHLHPLLSGSPGRWGWPRVHPPQDVLAEGRKGVLLVVPKDFKYNRLALDVFNEGLGHLHGNLEEKEPAVAQFSWEKDAASNSTGEVGQCKPVQSPTSLTSIPFPMGTLPIMKSQPFWVESCSFWSFSRTSTLSKVGLAGWL